MLAALSAARAPRRCLTLSFLSTLPQGVVYARNDSCATVRNSSGKLAACAANAPRFEYDANGAALGILLEGSSQNKCTNTNCNPSSTANMTKAGDAAATLTVVDDSAALAAMKLDALCTNGQVYKLDNTGGSTTAYVDISGATGNSNPHTFSVWARGNSGTAGALTRSGSTPSSVNITGGLPYARIVMANETVSGSTVLMRIRVNAGKIVWFILNQMEEKSFATSEIVVSGAAATRAADSLTLSLVKKPWFAEGAGYFGTRYRIKTFIPSTHQYLMVADDGTNNNTIGLRVNHTDYDAAAYVRAGNVSQNTNSTDDTHIAGVLNTAAISWKAGESIVLSGGLSSTKTYASDASGLTSLTIGARAAGAEPFYGNVTKIIIGRGYKSAASLGGKLYEAGDIAVIGGGQSLVRGYFVSNESSSEGGKQTFKQTIGLALPRKAVHFIDGSTGGTGASSTTDPVNYWWDLANAARGPAFATFYSSITASGIVPSAVLFELGETDAGAIKSGGTTRAQYKSAMQAIFADIQTTLGGIPIVLQKIGRRSDYVFDGAMQVVREVQDELIDELSYVYRGTEVYDATLYDGVHPNDAGFLAAATRNARVVANFFGAGLTGTQGPRVTGWSRSGTSVTVTLAHDGGTDFTPSSSIAGFHFFGGASEVTINAAVRTNATTVTLTLNSTPTGTEKLYYIYDRENSITTANILKDNASLVMPLKTYAG